jgi:hypothetical protein
MTRGAETPHFEAYRHDLRTYFQWAADAGLEVFAATRGHAVSPGDPQHP